MGLYLQFGDMELRVMGELNISLKIKIFWIG